MGSLGECREKAFVFYWSDKELNKPCVIGIHIATKAVQKGDELEVDANNGIVKILRRASK